eukprot:TRINITY_DN16180_c0_g1_i1.p3 TRINITY_DN16180_c0_g1~~TRINITY_DN16180_c0_g1_i1.p3  ORF type:complete len:120 (+),score=24.91 TRINITY_DN16180_c0_g1_i1:89-448(+)
MTKGGGCCCFMGTVDVPADWQPETPINLRASNFGDDSGCEAGCRSPSVNLDTDPGDSISVRIDKQEQRDREIFDQWEKEQNANRAARPDHPKPIPKLHHQQGTSRGGAGPSSGHVSATT